MFAAFQSCILLADSKHLYPLFDYSQTKQDILQSGSLEQLVTLRRHWSGERAVVWKADAFQEPGHLQHGQLLYYDDQGRLIQQTQAIVTSTGFILNGSLVRWSSYGETDQYLCLQAKTHQGKLHGELTLFWPNGHLRQKVNYHHGILQGPYVLYNEQGHSFEQGTYENGRRHGPCWRFDNEGLILEEINYHHGLAHGLCITLDKVDHIQCKKRFWMGFLHDWHEPALVQVRPDQTILLQAYYWFSQPSKTWTWFDEHSKVFATMHWLSPGKALANFARHPDSELKWENGHLVAPARGWYLNGNLAFEYCYAENEQFLLKRYRSDNHKLYSMSLWKEQSGHLQQHGLETTYNQDGLLQVERHWQDGKLLSQAIPTPKEANEKGISSNATSCQASRCLVIKISDDQEGEKQLSLHFNQHNHLIALEQDSGESLQRWHILNKSEAITPDKRLRFRAFFDENSSCYYLHQLDSQGKLKRKQTYSAHGQLLSDQSWNSGLAQGLWTEYYPNGQLKEYHEYANGRRHGYSKLWHLNGQLAFEGRYQDGLAIEKHVSYYPNGQMEFCFHFDHGSLEGPYKIFDGSGLCRLKATYRKDKLHGSFQQILEDGRKLECCFQDGQLEGPFLVYYAPKDGGQHVAFKATYHNGLRHGVACDYSKSGHKLREVPYHEGIIHGLAIHYHYNGKIAIELPYSYGKRHGLSKTFDDSGQCLSVTPFEQDLLEGLELIYDNGGQLIGENTYHLNLLDGFQRRYNPQGVLIYDAEWLQGQQHGWIRKYNDQGKLLLEMQFEHGNIVKKQRYISTD